MLGIIANFWDLAVNVKSNRDSGQASAIPVGFGTKKGSDIIRSGVFHREG